jgi:hypothetical protein
LPRVWQEGEVSDLVAARAAQIGKGVSVTNATNTDTMTEAIKGAVNEVIEASKRLETLKWMKKAVSPLLPEGAEIHPDRWSPTSIRIVIPKVEGRPWAGPNGTAGLVFQIRKNFGVTTFKRDTQGFVMGQDSPENFSTRFFGYTTIDNRFLSVTVDIPGDKPDHCEIVWEETVDTTPRVVRRAKSVCSTAA